MGLISFLALVVCIVALPLGCVKLTTRRLLIAVALLIAHLAATILYFGYTQTTVSDASFYYNVPAGFSFGDGSLGTAFVLNTVQYLKHSLGASFLDAFMVFQTIGFFGILITMRLLQEIQLKTRAPDSLLPCYLLFLPSVHFWSCAVGKDGPLFFATALCVWSVLKMRERLIYFFASLAVMVLFRAHVALIVTTSLATAAFFHGSISTGRKIALFIVAAAGILMLIGPVESTLNVHISNIDSITNFLNQRGELAAADRGHTSIGNAPFPIRLASLMFRPLFFDATGPLAMVASVENALVLMGFLYMIARWRDLRFLTKRVFFVRFAATLALVLLLSLALLYYNVGLGLRERVMAYPMVFSLLVALHGLRQGRRVAASGLAMGPPGPPFLSRSGRLAHE